MLLKVLLFAAAWAGIIALMLFVVKLNGRMYYGAAITGMVATAFKLFYTGDKVSVDVERVR